MYKFTTKARTRSKQCGKMSKRALNYIQCFKGFIPRGVIIIVMFALKQHFLSLKLLEIFIVNFE